MIWLPIILFILILILILEFVNNRRRRKKLDEVTARRPNLEKSDFVTSFVEKGYKKEQIEYAYDVLNKVAEFKKFSMYPDDDIYNLYELNPQDFEFGIYDIAKNLNLKIPNQEVIDPINEEYKNKMTFEFILKILAASTSAD